MVSIKSRNLLVDKNEKKCAHERFCKDKPRYSKHLRKFGDLGTVRIYDKKSRPNSRTEVEFMCL